MGGRPQLSVGGETMRVSKHPDEGVPSEVEERLGADLLDGSLSQGMGD